MKIVKMNLKRKTSDNMILLLAIIGTLTSLEKDKISVDEAGAFLFHPGMVDLLKSCHCRSDIIELIEEGCELEDVESLIPEALHREINRLCQKSLEILGNMSGQEYETWVTGMLPVQKKLRKVEYLETIYHSGILPKKKEWDRIERYTKDKKPNVRRMAARILGMYCCTVHERILRDMSYDKKGCVRVCAAVEMKMGIQEETLDRLMELMRDRKPMIRGNAVKSFFDVWVNRNGYTKSSMEQYRKKVGDVYKAEEDSWVLAFYERNRYLSGDGEALKRLKDFLCREGEFEIQSIAAELLIEIRKLSNESEVNRILEESERYVPEEWYFKKQMAQARKRREVPKILVVDKDNSGLSQMMEYLGETGEWQIESAGITPAAEIKPETVKTLLREDRNDITLFQYPKGIRNLWKYDYIVPLGIRLHPETYPLHRIVPIWEDVKENMLDVKQAEKMLRELKDYIDSDMIACRETEQLIKINQNQS